MAEQGVGANRRGSVGDSGLPSAQAAEGKVPKILTPAAHDSGHLLLDGSNISQPRPPPGWFSAYDQQNVVVSSHL